MDRSGSQLTTLIALTTALIVCVASPFAQDLAEPGASADTLPTEGSAPPATAATDGDGLSYEVLLERLRQLDSLPLERIWPEVRALKSASREATHDPLALLVPSVDRLTGNARLAAAALLLQRSDLHYEGQIQLQRIANDGLNAELRIAALRLLGASKFTDGVLSLLTMILNNEKNPEAIRLEAARAVLRLDGKNNSMSNALERFLSSPERDVRERAALALAEVDDFRPPVGRILRELSQEPTANGRLATRLLERPTPSPRALDSTHPQQRIRELERENRRLRERLRQNPRTLSGAPAVLAEILERVYDRGLFGRVANQPDLVRNALEALVSRMDPYGHFLTESDIVRLEARSSTAVWGVGLSLKCVPGSSPIVTRVSSSGSARQAGLRTGDRILEVNGVPTAGVTRRELRRFRSPRDHQFRLLYESWGAKPREVVLSGALMAEPSLNQRVLPHGIGYIQLPRFRPDTDEEVAQAVEDLTREDARVLLLDLRDNSGGDLRPAIRTADLFLDEEERPLLTEVFAGGHRVETMAQPRPLTRLPLIIIVNRFTASAAEVVAAALQDFRRATIVGESTFGKGLRQVLITPLPASQSYFEERCALLLTDGRLYRPTGSPLENGVHADLFVPGERETLGVDAFDELERVMYSSHVYDYLHTWADVVNAELAAGRVWTPRSYPELEDLLKKLETPLPREALAYAIDRLQRQRLLEDRGLAPWEKESGDAALHTAIGAALELLGENPAALAGYEHIESPRAGE